MKPIAFLVALMALRSSACARGYSFTFHGHRVHTPTLASPPSSIETMKPRQRPASSAARAQNTAKPQAKSQDDLQANPAATSPAVPEVQRSHESEEAAISALGDRQIGGKEGGLVRIEPCGAALCGYALDPSTGPKGETLLVDMKPKIGTR